SERRAGRGVGVSRSLVRYRSGRPSQAPLRVRLRELAAVRLRAALRERQQRVVVPAAGQSPDGRSRRSRARRGSAASSRRPLNRVVRVDMLWISRAQLLAHWRDVAVAGAVGVSSAWASYWAAHLVPSAIVDECYFDAWFNGDSVAVYSEMINRFISHRSEF